MVPLKQNISFIRGNIFLDLRIAPATPGPPLQRNCQLAHPEDNLSIIVLTNLAGASPDAFIDEMAGFFIPGMKEVNGFRLSEPVKRLRTVLEKSRYKNAIEELGKIKEIQ